MIDKILRNVPIFVSRYDIKDGDLTIYMVKSIRLMLRITRDQHEKLIIKTKSAGFTKITEYMRSILFEE